MVTNSLIWKTQPSSHAWLVRVVEVSAIRRSSISKAFSQLSSKEEDQNRWHVKSIHSIKTFLTSTKVYPKLCNVPKLYISIKCHVNSLQETICNRYNRNFNQTLLMVVQDLSFIWEKTILSEKISIKPW